MNKTMMVFPGQGSQYVGMGKSLYDAFLETRELFDQASTVLGRDIAKICFEGPEEQLIKTENAQVGIFLVSAAIYDQLKNQVKADYFAGHSLGELTALYAASVVDLKTAIELVVERGRCMSHCSKGSMAAILGQNLDNVEASLSEFEDVVVANDNSPGQLVISGSKEGVDLACQTLSDLDNVKRVIPLTVGGPFHSPLMVPAADAFAEYVNNIGFKDPETPIILNRHAEIAMTGQEIKENLPLQIKSPVRWRQSIMGHSDVDRFIECGPGKVLCGLIKKMVQDKTILSVSDTESLSQVLNQ